MVAETGHFALILTLTLALAQSVVPLIGTRLGDLQLMRFASSAAIGQMVFLTAAFAALIGCYVMSDFSVLNVAENSNSAMPLIYKVTAAWGNHEGSMLLWVLILAIFGAAVAIFGGNLPAPLKARALAVQGTVGTGFLAFILFTSNPFIRLFPAAPDGQDLNPLLQDIGLAIHPPFLYLGYVGFSMAFSFSVAALIEGKVDASWARWVRPWVLAAWCFLTIGITLGSFWAYYELGWGGWWFWDPVENASFMPWLAGTALLHSALVVERRQTLVNWTILLGILTFSLSLIGTFVVRSGVLTSVHSFAMDPARGVFILGLIALTSGGALALYAYRAPSLKQGAPFAGFSRESSLVMNNVLLLSACATVFLGTFYPLIIEATSNDKITVGAPFYNLTFVPMMIPLLIVMVLGPMLKWKRDSIRAGLAKLMRPAVIAGLVLAAILIATFGAHALAAFGFALAVWVIVGSLAILAHRTRLGQVPVPASLHLARLTPRSVYGLVLAHAGIGVTVAGITAMSAWKQEELRSLPVGGQLDVGGYHVTLKSVSDVAGPNYQAERALFDIGRNGSHVSTLHAERRYYSVRRTQTTEAGIHTNLFSNVYLAIGERNGTKEWTVRAYYHPLAPWIWFGPIIMALGGFVSLSDRRFRLGAPQRARRAPALAPAE
ncbi:MULTISPECIES: heme lyase CcmF/NrfE family subunit [Rhodomicrobium]|uniref:heme lyase CcmF/NrfE family subunit n=1 Tax=Rhodomicrobium TaxID=1068 RepID=UPI000B4A8EB6|nr:MULTISPECIES: heme lyase CcmF/NrfE family subunit [Rhodomicrobium]